MTEASEEAKAIIAKGGQIDAELTLRLLKDIKDERGDDFVYVNEAGLRAEPGRAIDCQNLHMTFPNGDDEPVMVPGCWVGAVFVNVFGLERTPSDGTATSTNEELDNPFDRESELILSFVQGRQDNGMPYGEVFTRAQQAVEEGAWR